MKTLAMAIICSVFCLPSIALQKPAPTPRERAAKVQGEASKGQQKSETNQCGSSESPCIVKVIPPDIDPKKADEETQKENQHAANEKWTAYATVVLAGITAILAVFTGLLWLITRKLVIDTRKSGIEATTIAQATASATVKHAEAAVRSADALVATQQSYVMVDIDWQIGTHILEGTGGKTKETESKSTSIYVVCSCRNEGKSFAQITEKGYVFKNASLDERRALPQIPDFKDIEIFHHASEYVIPNAAAEPYQFSAMCSGHRNSNSLMVIYGYVKYRDIFGKHETRFGYLITGMGQLDRLPTSSYPEYNRHT
jgi:hypothetical protein